MSEIVSKEQDLEWFREFLSGNTGHGSRRLCVLHFSTELVIPAVKWLIARSARPSLGQAILSGNLPIIQYLLELNYMLSELGPWNGFLGDRELCRWLTEWGVSMNTAAVCRAISIGDFDWLDELEWWLIAPNIIWTVALARGDPKLLDWLYERVPFAPIGDNLNIESLKWLQSKGLPSEFSSWVLKHIPKTRNAPLLRWSNLPDELARRWLWYDQPLYQLDRSISITL